MKRTKQQGLLWRNSKKGEECAHQRRQRLLCIFLAVLAVLSFASCGKEADGVEEETEAGSELKSSQLAVDDQLAQFELKDGLYQDATNGNQYRLAPASYEPVTLATGYGQLEDGTILYRLKDCDTKDYLSLEYDGMGDLFYGTHLTLPALSEMNVQSMLICDQDAVVIGLSSVTDTAVLSSLVAAISTGKREEQPAQSNNMNRLKFVSADYPMLYYTVIYCEDDSGNAYVYDRGTGYAVQIGDLLAEYIA